MLSVRRNPIRKGTENALLVERSAIAKLIKLAASHRWLSAVVLVTGLIASVSEGFGLTLFIPLLDTIQTGQPNGTDRSGLIAWFSHPFDGLDPHVKTLVLASLIMFTVILRALLAYANAALNISLSMRVLHDLRCQVFDSVLKAHFNFFEKNDSGRLVGAINAETNRTTQALKSLMTVATTGILSLVYVGLLVVLSWKLALVAIAVSTCVSFATKRLVESAKARGAAATRVNSRFIARMLEVMEAMPIVRAFGQQDREFANFEKASEQVSAAWYRMNVVAEGVRPIYDIAGAVLLLVVFATRLSITSDLSQLILFAFVLVRLQPRLVEMNRERVSINSNSSAIMETAAMLAPDEGQQPSGQKRLEKLCAGIRFEGIGYTYPNATAESLTDVDLTIGRGKFVALVGGSGAGKTTLIKLLLRFYDPDKGRITIDGDDLRDIDVHDWRRQIALVSQESYVFNASIAENISYGRNGATREDVVAAAKAADAHEFIERLPNGYDTLVGERGTRLSGGQKQRIALARAMVRNPQIFILDEATNQLDALTEQSVQVALMKLRHRCTLIVIAHRLATVQHADTIVVMRGGRIVETGNYEELVAADGAFRQLVDAQYLGPVKARDVVAG